MSSAPPTSTPADVAPEQPSADEPSLWWAQAWWLQLSRVGRAGSGNAVTAAAQLLSGLLFGIMLGDVLGWSTSATAVAAVVCAVLAWVGRGLVSLVVAATITLSTLAALFRVTMLVSADPQWDLRWLEPVALLLTVGILVALRRLGGASWSRFGAASVTIELLAGFSSLGAGWICVHRTATNLASGILLSSEDNAAWLNIAHNASTGHGVSAVTMAPAKAYGPVVDVFLTFTRSGTGGPWPTAIPASHTADTVLAAHVLLIAVAPVVAALLVRRTAAYRRPLLSLLAWTAITVGLEGYNLTFPSYGFFTAGLALLMVVLAASLVPTLRLTTGRLRPVLAWLAGAVLLYGAGASWLPLIPVGMLAVGCWYAAVAVPAVLKGPWSQVRLSAVLLAPAAAFLGVLYAQYHDVVGPLGGEGELYKMGGGTPTTTDVLTATAAVLVFAASLVRGSASASPGRRETVRAPLGWLAGYVVFIILLNGWQTSAPPQYGSVKLLYLTVGAIVALGVADLFASPLVGRRTIEVAAALMLVTLFVNSVQSGPAYTAATSHWPRPGPAYPWVSTLDRLADTPGRVLCLGLTPAPDLTAPSLQAYTCSRWISSLQGLDDADASNWRQMQLGALPIADGVAVVKHARALPLRLVVIGTSKQLKDPKGWWAPLVRLPGLKFVYVSG